MTKLPLALLLPQLILPGAVTRWLPLALTGQRLEDDVLRGLVPVVAFIAFMLLLSGVALFRSPRQSSAAQTAHGLLGLALGAVLAHVSIIAFGAPVFELWPQTALLALLLSCCTALPLALRLGCNPRKWLALLLELSPNDAQELWLLCSVLGALLGAYVGALPIPLDWDRPWQQWPLTSVHGTLLGHASGLLLGIVLSSRTSLYPSKPTTKQD